MEDFHHNYQTAAPDRYDILKEFTKENRHNSTIAEDILWQELRNKQLGVKFRRQHAIGDFIADFVAIDIKLIIEVDGGYHHTEEQQREDNRRTDILSDMGYTVIRFTNEEIFHYLEYVIDKIYEEIELR